MSPDFEMTGGTPASAIVPVLILYILFIIIVKLLHNYEGR